MPTEVGRAGHASSVVWIQMIVQPSGERSCWKRRVVSCGLRGSICILTQLSNIGVVPLQTPAAGIADGRCGHRSHILIQQFEDFRSSVFANIERPSGFQAFF